MGRTKQAKKTLGKAEHATFAGECEDCGESFAIGDWVIPVNEDGYEFYIHETHPSEATS